MARRSSGSRNRKLYEKLEPAPTDNRTQKTTKDKRKDKKKRRHMIADCARSPQQRSPQDAGPIAAAQAWPGKDDVAIAREGIEHREAAVHGGAYLLADAAAEAPAQRRAREQQRAAAVYLFVYQRAQDGAVGACPQLRLVDAVGRHLVLRQVDASFFHAVLFEVLPEVDELQCSADVIGVPKVFGRRLVEEMQHHPPDRIGGAAAVIQHLVEVRVAVLDHVLPKGAEQIVQGLQGQIGAPLDVGERDEDRIVHARARAQGIELVEGGGE